MQQAINRRDFLKTTIAGAVLGPLVWNLSKTHAAMKERSQPNIVLIYADDIGYGDIGCYGAVAVQTPNVDRLAAGGLRFTNAYASSATCTPSRYSLLTGRYAFRKEGASVLPGDAALLIDRDQSTLPGMLKKAGYSTGVVGKWHLGLGEPGGKVDWNGEIRPGPLEVGFDYAFLIPATGDRVPCVYVENHRVVNLDPADPIAVSYKEPFPNQPTGITHRDELKMDWSKRHNDSIVNGISRLGFMTGGAAALWKDEEMADEMIRHANTFIESRQSEPFFLYFSTHDIHVPRVPHPRFVGSTTMGPRGDAIVQFDWCVGQILDTLKRHELAENTLILLSSDNGPVLDDGYKDGAEAKLKDHRPGGNLRGGKASIFEAGTRLPFVAHWPEVIAPGVSDALFGQLDLFASLASLVGQELAEDDAPDSLDMLDTLLGKSDQGRDHLIQQADTLSMIKGRYKYVQPHDGVKVKPNNVETGSSPEPQLFDLVDDPGEKSNIAVQHPEIVSELDDLLKRIKSDGRTRKPPKVQR